LTESMVKKFVPQIGLRSKIFKKIEELKYTARNSYNGQTNLRDQDMVTLCKPKWPNSNAIKYNRWYKCIKF